MVTTRKISFVIPVKDEEATIEELAVRIMSVINKMGVNYIPEIILIDDGSIDNSWAVIKNLNEKYKGIIFAKKLRKNFGKALALETGFNSVTGDLVFTMDADLQDDPDEIPNFINKIDQGFDLVSGWKKRRNDPLSKTLPSRVFNKITSLSTGIKLHDFNCGFKCYKREVVNSIHVYGELHRYIPVLAFDNGYKIAEVEVLHHPRKHGKSKYGFERYIRGFVDLVTVLATTRWMSKPGHLFGGLGFFSGFVGFCILVYLTVLWSIGYGPIGDRPLFMLGILLIILSVQLMSLGVIAEFFIKSNKNNDTGKYVSEELR